MAPISHALKTSEIAKVVRSNRFKSSKIQKFIPEKAIGVELSSFVRQYILRHSKLRMEAILDKEDFDDNLGSLMQYADKSFLPNLFEEKSHI